MSRVKFHAPPSLEAKVKKLAAKKAKAKGKGKATNTSTAAASSSWIPNIIDLQNPNFPPPETWGNVSSTEDDEWDAELALTSSKYFEDLGTMRFYDAWGVKIFKKEIMSGRL